MAVTAHHVFAPSAVPPPRRSARVLATGTVRAGRQLRPGPCLTMLRDFYRDPLAWFGGLVALLVLAYGGGAVMFVLHAEILGELGPAISPVEHWALDSTLGFVALAPVLAVLVPLAGHLVCDDTDAVSPGWCAAVGGTLFGLATAPAPIVHDLLVGRGTWLANHVTQLLGGPAAVHHVHGDTVPQALSIAAQVVVGIPTYVLLLWLALHLVHAALRQREALRHARAVLARPPV